MNGYPAWSDIPVVTKNLIIINVLVFATVSLVPVDIVSFRNDHVSSLFYFLGLWPFGSEYFRISQVFTHMFHHSGMMHLAMNMMGLYFFGPSVELSLGHKRFLFAYLFCGFGAMFLQSGMYFLSVQMGYTPSGAFMLGASGAVMGLLGIFSQIAPNAMIGIIFLPMQFKASQFVWGLIGLEGTVAIADFMGIISSPVAHFAHLGGVIAGIILITFLKKRRE